MMWTGTLRKSMNKVLKDIRGQRQADGGFPPYVTLTGDRAAMIEQIVLDLRLRLRTQEKDR